MEVRGQDVVLERMRCGVEGDRVWWRLEQGMVGEDDEVWRGSQGVVLSDRVGELVVAFCVITVGGEG